MYASEYEIMAEVEDRHWWYVALRDLVVERLRLPSGALVADVGCGTGGTTFRILQAYPDARVVALDASPEALTRTKRRGARALVQASANELCLKGGSLDAVVCLDVLNHDGVRPDAALREFARVLKPGGKLLANVPAFSALRGRHDEAVGNDKRFTRGELGVLAAKAGLTVVSSTYWTSALAPFVLGWRLLSRALPGPARSDLELPRPWLNRALGGLARAELRLSRSAPLPFGVSLFLEATRR